MIKKDFERTTRLDVRDLLAKEHLTGRGYKVLTSHQFNSMLSVMSTYGLLKEAQVHLPDILVARIEGVKKELGL